MKEDEVGGTCGTHAGGERCLQGFWLGGLKVRDHWEGQGVGGRIILIRIFNNKYCVEGVDSTQLI